MLTTNIEALSAVAIHDLLSFFNFIYGWDQVST